MSLERPQIHKPEGDRDAGVQGMKVGGRRKLTIPSAMAYGARGAGGVIKPHEPLVFVVDLLSLD